MASNLVKVAAVQAELKNGKMIDQGPELDQEMFINKLSITTIATSAFIKGGSIVHLNTPVRESMGKEINFILLREHPVTFAERVAFGIADPVSPE